jgi:hypothetical protein
MKYFNIFYIIFFIILLNYLINYTNLYKKCIINDKNNKNINNQTENNNMKDFLNGYWTSDNEFAQNSEIDEMILNIDINSMTGFLVIIVDNKIVINDDFDIILNTNCNETEFVSNNINFIWNEKKFKMHIFKNKGLLQLYHNNILYASLYKDNKITALFN